MKYRSFWIFLLSVALIVAGARLPALVGAAQEGVGNNQISYARISGVHLDSGSPEDALSMRHKLSIIAKFTNSIDIPESLATMTSTRLKQVLDDTLDRYQQVGLLPASLPDVDSLNSTYEPYLVYWDDAKTRSNVFWSVSLWYGESSLDMAVDDQTGTVCMIHYNGTDHDWGWGETEAEKMEGVKNTMERLCRVYLEGLGTEFSNYNPTTISSGGTPYISEDMAYFSAEIQWGDILYGEVHLFFDVHTNGFSVSTY